MKKSELHNIVNEVLLQELDGMMSNQAKQTRRFSIQAEIKDLQQQLKDKQMQLSQIR